MSDNQFLTGTERGVSPVVGVILMVAITVILAAVIGTFVLDLGGDVSQSPTAGVSVDESDGEATITVVSMDNADGVEIAGDTTDEDDCAPDEDYDTDNCVLENVGDSVTATDDGSIIAHQGGDSAVIQTYDLE